MLRLEEACVDYGSFRALDGVSLYAAEGELVVLLGANGAGKSTIFLTISGLNRLSSGNISLRPKVLLLDEPSLGLAPLVVKQMFEIIEAINKRGTTVLLAEQNAFAALRIASRAYVIESGRIVLEGTPTALNKDERVRRAYLGG